MTNKQIFVGGKSHGKIPEEVIVKAKRIGALIASRGMLLVTGGTLGIPEAAVLGAKSVGGLTLAISPGKNFDEHVNLYTQSVLSDFYVYTGSGDMARNIFNIRSADAAIFLGGGMGTLNEFTSAYSEGKPIGVLTGTGWISPEFERIIEYSGKAPKNLVFFEDSPDVLIDKLLGT